MDRARRNVFLLISIAGFLLSLCVAPGCCRRCIGTREKAAPTDNTTETERTGVTVTKEVPHSKETISDIEEREKTNPLPSRGDRTIRSHKIPRTGSDNGTSIPPGDDQTVK